MFKQWSGMSAQKSGKGVARPRRRSGAGFGAGLAGLLIFFQASAAVAASLLFVAGSAFADEVQVSNTTMQDFEFDRTDGLLQFVDQNYNLWVGGIDPTTGNFVPASGEATLVDTNAALALTFGNGPEWVQDSSGYSIVYDKFQPGTTPANQSASTAFLAKATMISPAVWTVSALPDTDGLIVEEGNINPTQSDPAVVAANGIAPGNPPLDIEGINASMVHEVTNTYNTVGSYRLVTGMNALVYSEPASGSVNSTRQVFLYDITNNTTTQLTTDAGDKEFVMMFQAPEYNNAYILSAQVDNQSIRLYMQTPGSTAWTPFQNILAPKGAPIYNYKPTPFVYNNKTYFYMVRLDFTNPEDFSYPTQVWVASLDGTINKQVSNPALSEVEEDPKWYATTQGVFIYYNVYTVAGGGLPAISQGTWRSNSTVPVAVSTVPAPTNLQATAGSGGQVSLSWTGVSSATAYYMYNGATPGGESTEVGNIQGTSTSFKVPNAVGTAYFVVKAYDNNANNTISPASNEASATFPLSAPTGLTVAPGIAGQFVVSWNGVTGANAYYVYYGTSPGELASKSAAVLGTTTTLTGLIGGTTYYFAVQAYNRTSGVYSSTSGQVSATSPLAAPAGVSVTPGSAGQFSLSWSAVSGANEYYVYYSTVAAVQGNRSAPVTGTSATLTGLSGSTTYYFVVYAYNSASSITSPPSSQVSAITPLAAPGNLSVSGTGTGQVSLSWTGSSGASNYTVYYGTSPGAVNTKGATVTTTTATISGLSSGTLYYFDVEAYNRPNAVTSPASNQVSATPD